MHHLAWVELDIYAYRLHKWHQKFRKSGGKAEEKIWVGKKLGRKTGIHLYVTSTVQANKGYPFMHIHAHMPSLLCRVACIFTQVYTTLSR